jgi:hypothetical protein
MATITPEDFLKSCVTSAGAAGSSSSASYDGERALREWVVTFSKPTTKDMSMGLCCPGGHGPMVLVARPKSHGQGKMYICPKLAAYNQTAPSGIFEPIKRGDSAKLIGACMLAFDVRVPALLSIFSKIDFKKFLTGHMKLMIPDWSSVTCGCKSDVTRQMRDGSECVLPCCVISFKSTLNDNQTAETLGTCMCLCWASMNGKRAAAEKKKSFCNRFYTNLSLHPQNQKMLMLLTEARNNAEDKDKFDNNMLEIGFYNKKIAEGLKQKRDEEKKKAEKRKRTDETEDDASDNDESEEDEQDVESDSKSDETESEDDDVKKKASKKQQQHGKNYKKSFNRRRYIITLVISCEKILQLFHHCCFECLLTWTIQHQSNQTNV